MQILANIFMQAECGEENGLFFRDKAQLLRYGSIKSCAEKERCRNIALRSFWGLCHYAAKRSEQEFQLMAGLGDDMHPYYQITVMFCMEQNYYSSLSR